MVSFFNKKYVILFLKGIFFTFKRYNNILKELYFLKKITIPSNQNRIIAHLGLRSSGVGGLSPSSAPEFDFYVHACHPRGALPAHWACRMFSGPWGLVVMRVSWPEHHTLIKKKKL
jgi:hypothetical protein